MPCLETEILRALNSVDWRTTREVVSDCVTSLRQTQDIGEIRQMLNDFAERKWVERKPVPLRARGSLPGSGRAETRAWQLTFEGARQRRLRLGSPTTPTHPIGA